jgi:tRNA-splicing ligase RtcB
MANALSIPPAVSGALMPDAHLGYGLPIGGVLALDNAVCPYAVGVDIACRMKLSVYDIDPALLDVDRRGFIKHLQDNTIFGVGKNNERGYDHPVLHKDWASTQVTMQNYDRAVAQIGTSGSGNHFVEYGVLTVDKLGPQGDGPAMNHSLHLPAGTYVAIMSHSGSRGTGAAVCAHYSHLAKMQCASELQPHQENLGWLSLDSELGQEYWAAMTLMGQYAAANHDLIHSNMARSMGVEPVAVIENHHNFAWKETHGDRRLVVHRKGATPAGQGTLGIIPGSMGTPAYVVEGRGNENSLCSASHGAGRLMSRTQAKKTFNYREEIDKLTERGITVLSAGADEVCGVYKDIDDVIAAQNDLIDVVAKFEPKIVKMAGGNDRAED